MTKEVQDQKSFYTKQSAEIVEYITDIVNSRLDLYEVEHSLFFSKPDKLGRIDSFTILIGNSKVNLCEPMFFSGTISIRDIQDTTPHREDANRYIAEEAVRAAMMNISRTIRYGARTQTERETLEIAYLALDNVTGEMYDSLEEITLKSVKLALLHGLITFEEKKYELTFSDVWGYEKVELIPDYKRKSVYYWHYTEDELAELIYKRLCEIKSNKLERHIYDSFRYIFSLFGCGMQEYPTSFLMEDQRQEMQKLKEYLIKKGYRVYMTEEQIRCVSIPNLNLCVTAYKKDGGTCNIGILHIEMDSIEGICRRMVFKAKNLYEHRPTQEAKEAAHEVYKDISQYYSPRTIAPEPVYAKYVYRALVQNKKMRK